MKNKKLFAILTLVCFMMTLMPVAAFAANPASVAVDEDSASLTLPTTGTVSAKINVFNNAETAIYLYAVDANGKLVETGFPVKVDAGTTVSALTFAETGVYTVKAAKVTDYTDQVEDAGFIKTYGPAKALSVLGEYPVVVSEDANTVEVTSAAKNNYTIEANNVNIRANNGFDTDKVTVTLKNGADVVPNATLTVVTGSSAVTVDKTTLKTDAAGKASFKVAASIAGKYEIDVKYGSKAIKTIVVNAGVLTPATITNIYTPSNPMALDSALGDAGVTFQLKDANGNVITTRDTVDENDKLVPAFVKGTDYKVAVTEKPAKSAIKGDDLAICFDAAAGGYIVYGADLDKEGTYTFKVTLANGNAATATIEVKEFQTPVSIKLAYKAPSVELDGYNYLKDVKFVDANGVERKAETAEYKLAATGYAVDTFNTTTGTVKAKANEKYVGSTITVTAVATKYNLVATTSMVVANEAAAVKYATNKADVAVNNTLVANIVDEDGNKVALNTTAGALQISYVVLDKPENAKLAVSTADDSELAQKGTFKVSFTASEIGNYTVQTLVTYEQTTGVVKYYTGTETFTVGNTGFKDIVVMSIGSNEIVINAEKTTIDAAPLVQNDRTYVPFRALIEAFGAKVDFVEADQQVVAELNGTTVVMTIGSATYTVNGVEKTMDVAPFIAGDRTMIPVRFVAEAFGIKVTPTYDENGATADVLFAK